MESRMWTLKAILDCVNNSTPVLFGAPKDPSSSPTHLSDLRAYQWFWWERAGGVYPRFPLIKLPPSWDQSGSCSLRDTTIFAFALCCPSPQLDDERGTDSLDLSQPTMAQEGELHWLEDRHWILYWIEWPYIICPRYLLDICSALCPYVPFLFIPQSPGPTPASAQTPTNRVTITTPTSILWPSSVSLKMLATLWPKAIQKCIFLNLPFLLPHVSLIAQFDLSLKEGEPSSTWETAPSVPFKLISSISSDGGKMKQMTNERHKADAQPSHHGWCGHTRHILNLQSLCPQIRFHMSPQSGRQPLLWHAREIEQVFKGHVKADADLLTKINPIWASRGGQPGLSTWKYFSG